MSRLHKLAPQPRFRLSWLDYAASLFVAGMLGLLFLLWNLTPPLLLVRWRVILLLMWQNLRLLPSWTTLFGGIALACTALSLAALILIRPRWRA